MLRGQAGEVREAFGRCQVVQEDILRQKLGLEGLLWGGEVEVFGRSLEVKSFSRSLHSGCLEVLLWV